MASLNPFASTVEAASTGGSIANGVKQDIVDNAMPAAVSVAGSVGTAAGEYMNKKAEIAGKPNNYTNSGVPAERALGRTGVLNSLTESGALPEGYNP